MQHFVIPVTLLQSSQTGVHPVVTRTPYMAIIQPGEFATLDRLLQCSHPLIGALPGTVVYIFNFMIQLRVNEPYWQIQLYAQLRMYCVWL